MKIYPYPHRLVLQSLGLKTRLVASPGLNFFHHFQLNEINEITIDAMLISIILPSGSCFSHIVLKILKQIHFLMSGISPFNQSVIVKLLQCILQLLTSQKATSLLLLKHSAY